MKVIAGSDGSFKVASIPTSDFQHSEFNIHYSYSLHHNSFLLSRHSRPFNTCLLFLPSSRVKSLYSLSRVMVSWSVSYHQ